MEPDLADPRGIPAFLASLGVALPEGLEGRLQELSRHIAEARQIANLTGLTTAAEIHERLVIRSLLFLPVLDRLAAGASLHLVDVGSGAGLPGLPLALARPAWQVVALEARRKKLDLLLTIARRLGCASVAPLAGRAEEAGQDPRHREAYQAATCQAVGPLAETLEYALPLVRPGGLVLVAKGREAHQELAAGSAAAKVLGGGEPVVHTLDAGGRVTRLVEVAKRSPTPALYPRRPGMPRKRPLGSQKGENPPPSP